MCSTVHVGDCAVAGATAPSKPDAMMNSISLPMTICPPVAPNRHFDDAVGTRAPLVQVAATFLRSRRTSRSCWSERSHRPPLRCRARRPHPLITLATPGGRQGERGHENHVTKVMRGVRCTQLGAIERRQWRTHPASSRGGSPVKTTSKLAPQKSPCGPSTRAADRLLLQAVEQPRELGTL